MTSSLVNGDVWAWLIQCWMNCQEQMYANSHSFKLVNDFVSSLFIRLYGRHQWNSWFHFHCFYCNCSFVTRFCHLIIVIANIFARASTGYGRCEDKFNPNEMTDAHKCLHAQTGQATGTRRHWKICWFYEWVPSKRRPHDDAFGTKETLISMVESIKMVFSWHSHWQLQSKWKLRCTCRYKYNVCYVIAGNWTNRHFIVN